MNPALFLDRDGVIIENRANYVRQWEDVAFIPSSLKALASISTSRLKIVVVTNQSAVGRGIISLDQSDEINRRVREIVEQAGGRIDAVYTCPHAPQAGCACRKPQPGLLRQAAADLSIDLARSVMIGDALDDLRAGQNAGVARTILVRTGRGEEQLGLPGANTLKPFDVCDNLLAAIKLLSTPPGTGAHSASGDFSFATLL